VIFCIIARYILQPEDFSSGFFICLYRLHGDVINGIISFVFSSLIHYFSTLGKLGYVHKRMLKMVVMENPPCLVEENRALHTILLLFESFFTKTEVIYASFSRRC